MKKKTRSLRDVLAVLLFNEIYSIHSFVANQIKESCMSSSENSSHFSIFIFFRIAQYYHNWKLQEIIIWKKKKEILSKENYYFVKYWRRRGIQFKWFKKELACLVVTIFSPRKSGRISSNAAGRWGGSGYWLKRILQHPCSWRDPSQIFVNKLETFGWVPFVVNSRNVMRFLVATWR